jgi:sirohydrochlorin cobaltochelatase
MTLSSNDRDALQELERRFRTILPEEYQDSYEDREPIPMKSAGLKYDAEGKVAWNEIWSSFCDLAMAGGPPHKGTLLEPGRDREIAAEPQRYDEVVDEICRGISMATDLDARPSPIPGWVRVPRLSDGMAGWLLRAIVMENVAARSEGTSLDLPAAPHFRPEREIKNVVTVIAKTSHYWLGHMPRAQRVAIAGLFVSINQEAPLITPAFPRDASEPGASETMVNRIARDTGLRESTQRYTGWLGLECPSVRSALWMMRAMVASNVLSRRESTVLFVPVNPESDPGGDIVAARVGRAHGLARLRGIL